MDPGHEKPIFPWDLTVILVVTLIGFAYTLQRAAVLQSPDNRSLASLAEVTSGLRALDLGCIEEATGVARLREDGAPTKLRGKGPLKLRGRFCRKAVAPGEAGPKVKNLTTGETAMVYLQSGGASFTTSEIVMAEGPNSIQILWRDSDGKERVADFE